MILDFFIDYLSINYYKVVCGIVIFEGMCVIV